MDLLRCLGCIAVVTIHSTAEYALNRGPGSKLMWLVSLSLNSLSRWAVPVFVMVSGAVLIGKYTSLEPDAIRQFYKKRLPRIALLILFWSTAYFVWTALFEHYPLTVGYVIDRFFLGNPYKHLYFLFLILGLYLATPVIGAICKQISRRQLYTATAALLLGASAWETVFYFNSQLGPEPLNAFGQWVPYIGYYMAGYVLLQELRGRHHIPRIWVLFALSGLILEVIGVYLAVRFEWNGTLFFHENLMPIVAMEAIGVFVLGYAAYGWFNRRMGEKLDRLIGTLAPLTLGIYLVHIMVLGVLQRLMFGIDVAHSLPSVLILLFLTLTISGIITYLLRLTPIGRRYLLPE